LAKADSSAFPITRDHPMAGNRLSLWPKITVDSFRFSRWQS
jgi:hypothetical protein